MDHDQGREDPKSTTPSRHHFSAVRKPWLPGPRVRVAHALGNEHLASALREKRAAALNYEQRKFLAGIRHRLPNAEKVRAHYLAHVFVAVTAIDEFCGNSKEIGRFIEAFAI